jgi:hypothetical protein
MYSTIRSDFNGKEEINELKNIEEKLNVRLEEKRLIEKDKTVGMSTRQVQTC